MSLIEVLLALCFCGVLLLGTACLVARLRAQLLFCEEMNREILLARDRIEKILLDGKHGAASGSETVESEDGFRFSLDWRIADDVPVKGLGLLTLEMAPSGGRTGKLVCKTWVVR
jgi:hypothetical protein